MRKNIYIIIFIFLLFFFLNNRKEDQIASLSNFTEKDNLVVAGCPTFHYMLDKLDQEGISIIKTGSTGESLSLIENGLVDFVISGRSLREGEAKLSFHKIGRGYDVIHKDEIVIFEKEMGQISFLTDLDIDQVINDFEYISDVNLVKINDLYEYLDKGVIITSLDGHLIGNMAHILKENGSRVRLSRSPRIYFSSELEKEKLESIKEIIKEN